LKVNEQVVNGPAVYSTWVEIRGAMGRDPGEVAPIYFIVEAGVLTLTDAQGRAGNDNNGALRIEIRPGEAAVAVARRLARRASGKGRAWRDRPLFYTDVVIV
jgi:hypothetical protein